MWLGDATAVWAESFVYPLYNREHETLETYFSDVHNELVLSNEKKEYGSYIMFYFLHQYTGSTQVIADILKGAAGTNIRGTVMNKITSYADTFAKFALYNWNQAPYYRAYQDSPFFPDVFPHGKSVEARFEKGPKDVDIKASLDKGAIKYIAHTFVPDVDKVKRVKFTFDSKNADPHLRRQALIKIGDAWNVELWNDITEREFDRRKPEENIKAVIVVFPNADLMNKKEVKYNLKIDNSARYKGHTKMTSRMTAQGLQGEATFTSEDILKYDKDKNAYVLTERKMTYNLSCKARTAGEQAHGSLTETYSLEEAPLRLILESDGTASLKCDPARKNKKWITYSTKSGFGSETHIGDVEGTWWWSGDLPIPKGEVTKTVIRGSQNMNSSQPGGQVIFVIEYYYELD